MSLFNLPVEPKTKPPQPVHPWTRTIKEYYANKIRRAHNSVRNVCRNQKEKTPSQKRVTFTVIGNRMMKEFIYCVHLVQGMHKYRWKNYDAPIIKGCTGVEWADHLQKIKMEYGSLGFAIQGQVAVLCDNQLVGGEKELKDLIESKYIYHLALNYQKESIRNFAYYLKSSSRPCTYMHISIDGEPIGSLIFMLYSDVVPATCENFLRLSKAKRGGYSGAPIHRVVKDGWIQGGGFSLTNNNMDCENFIVPHNKRGVLGMANAGRHIDCSTQFYVLLQPNDWLTECHRFVAFGQLIDGEETLKKIEGIETYYEAPTANIVIYSAGIVNLDCHDIIINKGALSYLDEHIEDLVTIGELFYEMLMERVYLEIVFRKIKKLEQAGEDAEEHSEVLLNEAKVKTSNDSDKDENIEFNVDMSESYEAEVSNVWPPSVPVFKGTKPYFLPMTDVPYPGEVDSNFDLKRLLQGDYCLEADLDPNVCKKYRHKLQHEDRIRVISELIDNQHRHFEEFEMDISSEGSSVESDEVREIQDYIRNYGDCVSFTGKTVKSVADKVFRANPIETKGPNEKFSDEDVRLMRVALQELRNKKKVIISSRESMSSRNQIIRRPTGYVRPEDMVQLRRKFRDRDISIDEDDEEEEQKEEIKDRTKRKISISVESEDKKRYIQTKDTAYIRPEDLFKAIEEKIATKVEEDEEDIKAPTAFQNTVRISPDAPTKYFKSESKRSSSLVKKNERLSVLGRLFEEVTVKNDEIIPTLKDYKPITELKNDGQSSLLSKDSTASMLRRSVEEKTLKFGETTVQNHPFIKARENARKRKQVRPSITVSQYKKMNENKREEVEKTKEKLKTENEDLKIFKGSLRLPGDTPLYSPISLSSPSTEYQIELEKSQILNLKK